MESVKVNLKEHYKHYNNKDTNKGHMSVWSEVPTVVSFHLKDRKIQKNQSPKS